MGMGSEGSSDSCSIGEGMLGFLGGVRGACMLSLNPCLGKKLGAWMLELNPCLGGELGA